MIEIELRSFGSNLKNFKSWDLKACLGSILRGVEFENGEFLSRDVDSCLDSLIDILDELWYFIGFEIVRLRFDFCRAFLNKFRLSHLFPSLHVPCPGSFKRIIVVC